MRIYSHALLEGGVAQPRTDGRHGALIRRAAGLVVDVNWYSDRFMQLLGRTNMGRTALRLAP
ncbi:MAG: hypothetical protein M3117_01985 [Actinomycetota bacterium]|nr:hypothetical protein [Actinomycetota bacterium]